MWEGPLQSPTLLFASLVLLDKFFFFFKLWNYVITISEKGSLNRAAEVLFVTQPSLTSALRELERELGVTLFSRSGRGVTLTNDGVEFVRYAREVLGYRFPNEILFYNDVAG